MAIILELNQIERGNAAVGRMPAIISTLFEASAV